MSRLRRWTLAALLGLAAVSVGAVAGPPVADQPEGLRQFDSKAQEQRYWDLLGQLRCLVCQNESLAASQADLAEDLRDEVYTQMVDKGKDNEAIIDYLVDRYGQFVLYQPPFEPLTYLLWTGPFLLLIIGFTVLAVVVRQRRRAAADDGLSDDERARVAELLETESDKDKGA